MRAKRTTSWLSWEDVDIFLPPKLSDTTAEMLRLNELLAAKLYSCKEKMSVDDGLRGAFKICVDERLNTTMRNVLFISGEPEAYLFYLTSVISKRWTFMIPSDFHALELLGNVDIEMHYLFKLSDRRMWDIDHIVNKLSSKQFDTSLISFYPPTKKFKETSLREFNDALFLTKRVLKVLQSDQLQLVVKVDEHSVYDWYILLYRMFFDYHYALIGAASDFACGRRIHRCQYRLSFMRRDHHQVNLPVFGFGSPLEERKRLIKYLTTNKNSNKECDVVELIDNDVPVLCKMNAIEDSCIVLYMSYRQLQKMDNFNNFLPCRIWFFTPVVLNQKLTTSASVYPYGLSPYTSKNLTVPDSSTKDSWSLITVKDLLNFVNQEKIHKLVLDLDGGEWDIFPALLETAKVQNSVSNLELRVRFWVGEDSENYRRILMYFLRLETLGFKKMFGKMIDATTAVVAYKNEWQARDAITV